MFSFCITHIIDADCELIFFVQVVTIFSVCDLAFFRGILCCYKFNKGSPLGYKVLHLRRGANLLYFVSRVLLFNLGQSRN